MGLPCDWQVNKQKVSERGQYLLESGQWSDCKFVVGQEPHQQTLKAHKLFLAMSSPVFEAMFFGGMAEKNDPIQIRDVQPEAFNALLTYIYTDRVDLGSFELACELCYCAKKYMLPSLVEECTQYLWSDLSPKKACRAYEFAKLFEEPVFMDKCLQVIRTKTNDVLKESSWEEVELGTLLMVLDQEQLEISSEIALFAAMERWAKAECTRKSLDPNDGKSLKSVIGDALLKIRFLSLTPQEFAEGPGMSQLLTTDEAFPILMNILCSCNKTPMPEGFSTNRQTREKPLITQTSDTNCSYKLSTEEKFFTCYPDWGTSPSSRAIEHIERQNMLRNSAKFIFNGYGGRKENGNSSTDSPPVVIDGGIREGPKYYCMRSISQQTDCVNANVLDCAVTFCVDKNICVLGVQVPTQIAGTAHSISPVLDRDSLYTEILYAHLLDSDDTRLTYTHFTTKVRTGTLLEITFNRPVYIQKHKMYRVGVVFNKAGCYPMGVCAQNMICDSVYFSFGIGDGVQSLKGSLIRSIIFAYH